MLRRPDTALAEAVGVLEPEIAKSDTPQDGLMSDLWFGSMLGTAVAFCFLVIDYL